MNKGSIIQEKEATLLFVFGSKSLYFPIESQGILVFYLKFEEVLHSKIRLGDFYFETEFICSKTLKYWSIKKDSGILIN